MAHRALLDQYAKQADLEVDVLTSGVPDAPQIEQLSPNITVRRIRLHKKHLHHWRKIEVIEWLSRAKRLYRRMLREKDYALVHAFFGFPTGYLCYKTRSEIPYIISLRGSDVPGRHARLQLEYKILAPLFSAIWRNAAAVVACSEGLKQRANRFLGSVDIRVIPNGVDTARFHPPGEIESADHLRLLTVGRLSVTKRVDMLLEAVELLIERGCRVKLKIVGGGPLENELRELARRKQIESAVEFTGRVDPAEMPEIYRHGDIFVSASMQEGMSNAMLEAIATNLPVVTTRCEGVEELVTDNGLIIDSPEPAEIADAIETLVADPDRRKTMSAAATQKAEQYTPQTPANKYLNLYKAVL